MDTVPTSETYELARAYLDILSELSRNTVARRDLDSEFRRQGATMQQIRDTIIDENLSITKMDIFVGRIEYSIDIALRPPKT